ncbi:hypothetical protein JZK55_18560 [Dissulfurispira thermophila]|uniref:DUF1640 domain-containing protein n=1 Tax=Dissulfurispira thermophila TaxID=2715679 RepID=A0A7G1H298_9BACT|nr:hypothetical protein [Dissulfurispira thermophila]BCB96934.1 hypothetical protein JZK55_18560 [Dissulfurispira thermophila]
MPTLELEERVARLEGRIDEHLNIGAKFFESISVKLTLLEDKGDRNKEDLEQKIDRTNEKLEKKIDNFREELNQKIDKVNESLNQKIDKNREELNQRIDKLEMAIDLMRKEIYTNFRWIVGIQITTWITVLLAILFNK